jgi:catechol 2,3-dioxygenase-like lactoylglutathione lyase family enzyme
VAELAQQLAAAGLAIEQGPVARSGATGPLQSIYLRDPDGNLIELANRTG